MLVEIVKDDFWRGWLTILGITKCHNLPVVQTNQDELLKAIHRLGGFGFWVSRNIGNPVFQRGIDGVTASPWGHAGMLIGEYIGNLARIKCPELKTRRKSKRWRPIKGYPDVWLPPIKSQPSKFEVVESQAEVTHRDLTDTLNMGEQVIVFIPEHWSDLQRVAMAIEAYSWVGEPYDVFEIGSHFMQMFNPARLKVCSSLTLQCIAAGAPGIIDWCKRHGLDPEKVSPRDIFAYGADLEMPNYCFRCDYRDALAVRP